MAAFGNFCSKSIWNKFPFQVPTSKKSDKNNGTFVMSILKVV